MQGSWVVTMIMTGHICLCLTYDRTYSAFISVQINMQQLQMLFNLGGHQTCTSILSQTGKQTENAMFPTRTAFEWHVRIRLHRVQHLLLD